MLRLGEAMIDVASGAGVLESMRPERFSGFDGSLDVGRCRSGVSGCREVGAVVGEDRVDLVGNRCDETTQEVGGGAARDLLVQLDEGELGRSVDGDQKIELSLRCPDFGDVDVEVADRGGFELPLGGSLALDARQLRNPMPLQAPVQ